MKKSILLFSFLFLLISCKTTFNLQNEKNADEQIIECLQSKKIVFIGENHSTVFPILYMTQNMENFYNAGLRYLFLEEEGDGFGKDSDFKILSDKYLRYELSEEYLLNYDFFCATNKRVYGIINPYITTDYNLQALYNFIVGFDVKKQTPYRAYDRLSINYSKIGNEEKSHYYKNKKDFLEKVFPWHDIEMYFFGYYNQ